MSLDAVVSPYQPINGLTGLGLNNGSLYIGLDGQDPQAYPQQCYWDAAGAVPAAQPVQVMGGYPMRLGTPARLYTAETYSIRVRDATGAQVFYEANAVKTVAAAGIYATRAAAVAAQIPTSVQALSVTLLGYYAAGDGGGGVYHHVGGSPGHGASFQSADGAWWELVEGPTSTLQFGIKHDGTTDNQAAFTGAMAWLAAYPGSTLLVAAGTACTTGHHIVPDQSRIVGEGETSWIASTYVGGGPDQWKSPLWLGNWHPVDYGHRAAGSGGAWIRYVTRYRAAGVVSEKDNVITLATHADAANFTVGSIYVLTTDESSIQNAGADEYEIPLEQSLVRVIGADPATGRVTIDYSAGFTSATAPWLSKVTPGAVDTAGPVYFAQGIRLSGLGVRGFAGFGTVSTGAFECRMTDCQVDCTHFLIVNGFAHCEVRNIQGRFAGRAGEFKFGAHDSAVSGIQLYSDDTAAGIPGMLSTGEACRNISWEDYEIIAPNWIGDHVWQIQPGGGCRWSNGRVFTPKVTNTPIQFYSDPSKAVSRNTIDNLDITHASGVLVVFANDLAFDPTENTVSNVREVSLNTGGAYIGCYFLGGSRNKVENCIFQKGNFIFDALATDNVCFGNITPDAVVTGSGADLNSVFGYGFSAGAMTAYASSAGLPAYFVARGFTSGGIPAAGGGKLEYVNTAIPPYVRLFTDDGTGTATSAPVLLYGDYAEVVRSTGGVDTAIAYFQAAQWQPGGDNITAVGHPAARMSVIYAATGAINTSDEREKTDVLDVPDALLDAVRATKIVSYRWIHAVEAKGQDGARHHVGILAQELYRQCLLHGVEDPMRYGVLCKDEWPDQYEHATAAGEPTFDEAGAPVMRLKIAAGERWGIRPDEWAMLCHEADRREHAAIRAELAALTARLDKAGA